MLTHKRQRQNKLIPKAEMHNSAHLAPDWFFAEKDANGMLSYKTASLQARTRKSLTFKMIACKFHNFQYTIISE